jgi:CRISPR/Cas system CSM-associated protein Csm3 (group 7 of RAMP superfamily)
LLVRDGRYSPHGSAKDGFPQCLFISRRSNTDINILPNQPPKLPYYVPGTSIRGPFRAHAERIIRTLCAETAFPPFTACDPFQEKRESGPLYSCSKQLEAVDESRPQYARVCIACRIFGCAGLASRILFTDGDIKDGYASVYRDMIGIDRFTGGVSANANMKLHVLENTKFETVITITNFELWHLGLMAYVFQDFKDGLVPIGFGKTKGFGQVTGKVVKIGLTYNQESNCIEHLGSLMAEKECIYYDVNQIPSKEFEGLESPGDSSLSWYHRRTVKQDKIDAFFETVAIFFNEKIKAIKKEAA